MGGGGGGGRVGTARIRLPPEYRVSLSQDC